MKPKKPSDADGAPEPTREASGSGGIGRRAFLTGLGVTAAAATVASTRTELVQRLLRNRFQELLPADLERVLGNLEREHSRTYGKQIKVSATPAREGVVYGYGLDLSRCVGCRRCVYACVKENNLSRDPQIHWIRVLKMAKEEGINLHNADPYYDDAEVPDEDSFYVPVACQQCSNAPCVRSCPVQATWQEPDGIVVIDYDQCIGCRCCMAACPYGARHFNWAEPKLEPDEVNPDTHYLGNRPRMRGVVEKCTFCIHRVRNGRYPACVEICPVGARKFGNLLDENSEIRQIMREKRVFVLKEELNTQPKFYYFFG